MFTGYTRPLYILPFDHRASYISGLFGWEEPLNVEQMVTVADSKHVIYEGFQQAIADQVPKDHAGILVDEEFGSAILRDAASKGFITAVSTEKSGQVEFEFELEGQLYRVVRKRSRGKQGQSDLQFQLRGDGDWRSLSEGGVRGTQGPVTVDFSGRFYNKSFGYPNNPAFYQFGGSYSESYDVTALLRQQTYGLNVSYAATPRWRHTLVLGYDRRGFEDYQNRPLYSTPADTFLREARGLFASMGNKPALADTEALLGESEAAAV